jgi:hypothetical protein
MKAPNSFRAIITPRSFLLIRLVSVSVVVARSFPVATERDMAKLAGLLGLRCVPRDADKLCHCLNGLTICEPRRRLDSLSPRVDLFLAVLERLSGRFHGKLKPPHSLVLFFCPLDRRLKEGADCRRCGKASQSLAQRLLNPSDGPGDLFAGLFGVRPEGLSAFGKRRQAVPFRS